MKYGWTVYVHENGWNNLSYFHVRGGVLSFRNSWVDYWTGSLWSPNWVDASVTVGWVITSNGSYCTSGEPSEIQWID
jgi:hypothetical protein